MTNNSPLSNPAKWWQKAVFYQIYPRSFADGNGDGIGDFQGIIDKLDYLEDLGIDAIWLSPHYPSPFLDCGYDIADYTAVAPEYGSMDDFKTFLAEAHSRSIRVVLDFVLNHTSDQHPWFLESRASLDNPKRDWYVWRDGQADAPPNDWVSIFGGSAWEADPLTGQYYYHAFLKEQPDLNWRNPEVKKAMWDAVRFWLELGVDGFRLDAVATVFENPDLPNHNQELTPNQRLNPSAMPIDEYWHLMRFQMQQPGLHELMQSLRSLVDEYPGDRVLIGEDEDVAFHGRDNDELHLVFNFPLMRVERVAPASIRANQAMRLAELPPDAWPCNTLGNHDTGRVWERYGDGVHDAALARLHLALMLTLKGTPFLYNGEEIGMTDLGLTNISDFQDTFAVKQYQTCIEQHGISHDEAFKNVAASTRDRCRTPLQWSNTPNAGFSPPSVKTWLPVHPNYRTGVTVADQDGDDHSLLNFYRRMLRLRRATPALVAGDYHAVHQHSEAYFAFLRYDAPTRQTCLVILNFTNQEQDFIFDLVGKEAHFLFSNTNRNKEILKLDNLIVFPFEILILELCSFTACR